jgi:outer membrane protein OmpA-like peptidoglycan-associated protein
MKKMLTVALAALTVASAVAQESNTQYKRHELTLVTGVNTYGLAAGYNNSEWGPFPTDWSVFPYQVGMEYAYTFTPTLTGTLGFSYNTVSGINSVEKFSSTSFSPMLGLALRPFNYGANFLNGLSVNAGIGMSGFSAERRFVSDNTMHVPQQNASAAAMSTGISYRYPINHALAVSLRLGTTLVMSDEFDAWDFGTGSDIYSSAGVGLTYVIGAKKGDKSLSEQTVEGLRKGELDNLATKDELGALGRDVKELDGKFTKLEADLASMVRRSDLDTIVKEIVRSEVVTKKVGGKQIKALATVYYRFDADEIDAKYLSYIDQFMREYKEGDAIILIGYADMVGSSEYNKNLSRNRAEGVKDYLVTKYGVPANVITTNVGEVKIEAKAQQFVNRRVDLFLY